MSGRYGSDTFGNFLCVTALVCLVIGLFVGIFYYIGLLLLLYAYFRMLSRNVHKRYAENIALCRKPLGGARQVRPAAAAVCPAQNLPLFFLPALP